MTVPTTGVPSSAAAVPGVIPSPYRYQPTYPEGHELAGQPMGGEQLVEHDGTWENLAAKLTENNNRIQAEMRRIKAQHGVDVSPDDEPLPAEAMSRDRQLFQRRDLTPEERIRYAKGMANPNTIQETFDEMTAARVGTGEDFSQMTALQIRNIESQAGQRFGREHPEITSQANDTKYKNPYGYEAIVPRDAALLLSWCDKRKLYHTYENLVLAWERLKKAGLLSTAPIAARENPADAQLEADEAEGADSPEVGTQPTKRRVATSSALSSRNATSGNRQPVQRTEPTWKEFEALTVDQVAAKPAEWKLKILRLIQKMPQTEVAKHLNNRTLQQKMDQLG